MSAQRIEIRKATREELLIIKNLAPEIWPGAFQTILSPLQIQYMLQMMYSIEVLQADFERGVQFYILWVNEEPAGYASIEKLNAHAFKLHKIYLYQKLQGKGLGKALLQFIEETVIAHNAGILYLNVNRYNKALDFYKSQGYTIYKTEDIDIGNGFFMNDYVMRKTLL